MAFYPQSQNELLLSLSQVQQQPLLQSDIKHHFSQQFLLEQMVQQKLQQQQQQQQQQQLQLQLQKNILLNTPLAQNLLQQQLLAEQLKAQQQIQAQNQLQIQLCQGLNHTQLRENNQQKFNNLMNPIELYSQLQTINMQQQQLKMVQQQQQQQQLLNAQQIVNNLQIPQQISLQQQNIDKTNIENQLKTQIQFQNQNQIQNQLQQQFIQNEKQYGNINLNQNQINNNNNNNNNNISILQQSPPVNSSNENESKKEPQENIAKQQQSHETLPYQRDSSVSKKSESAVSSNKLMDINTPQIVIQPKNKKIKQKIIQKFLKKKQELTLEQMSVLSNQNTKVIFSRGILNYLEFRIMIASLKKNQEMKKHLQQLLYWIKNNQSLFNSFKGWKELYLNLHHGQLLQKISKEFFSKSYLRNYLKTTRMNKICINEHWRQREKFLKGFEDISYFQSKNFKLI